MSTNCCNHGTSSAIAKLLLAEPLYKPVAQSFVNLRRSGSVWQPVEVL